MNMQQYRMKKQLRQCSSAYDVWKKSSQNVYPELLVNVLQNQNALDFQKKRVEKLLSDWARQFMLMSSFQRNFYHRVIFAPKFLTKCLNVCKKGHQVSKLISILYQILMEKWSDLTKHLKNGLGKNEVQALRLLWIISSTCIEEVGSIQIIRFTKFLSSNFENCIFNYKWKSHPQKVYILQIVKFLNSHKPLEEFIHNGKQWINLMLTMKNQPFIPKNKLPNKYQVCIYEYQQKESNSQTMAESQSKKDQKKSNKTKVPKSQVIEINPFIHIKDAKDEADIYYTEIWRQILYCRSLLWVVDQDFWKNEVLLFLNLFEKKIEDLNKENFKDVLLLETFGGLLKLDEVQILMRQNIDEKIIIPIMYNQNKSNSPFKIKSNYKILQFIKLIYTHPKQDTTLQKMIQLRIKSILKDGANKKDDIVNRYMMQLFCKDSLTLKKYQFSEIIAFITNHRRKSNILVETMIILIQILTAGMDSPDVSEINFMIVIKNLPEMIQSFIASQQIQLLRQKGIELFLKILRTVHFGEQSEETVIRILYQWLQVVEINFPNVNLSMIQILNTMNAKFSHSLMNIDTVCCEKIVSGISMKLGRDPSPEKIYQFLKNIIDQFYYFKRENAFTFYNDVDRKIFPMILLQQADIIFKDQFYENNGRKKSVQMMKQKKKNYRDEETEEEKAERIERQKYNQIMEFYIGPQQKKWIQGLIEDQEIWENQQILRLRINLVQQMILNGVISAEDNYFIPMNKPNLFYQNFIKQIDHKLVNLFKSLMQKQLNIQLFNFATKIYLPIRDYWFICTLQSYKLLRNQVFSILSVHFNKNQVLYATALFTSQLLPYIDSNELQKVHHHFNQDEFLTDLFKGSNEFMTVEKKYYPILAIILMAYEITQPIRQSMSISEQIFSSLNKNLQWWENLKWQIAPELVPEEYSEELKDIVFDTNKDKYRKDTLAYFNRYMRKIRQVFGYIRHKKEPQSL